MQNRRGRIKFFLGKKISKQRASNIFPSSRVAQENSQVRHNHFSGLQLQLICSGYLQNNHWGLTFPSPLQWLWRCCICAGTGGIASNRRRFPDAAKCQKWVGAFQNCPFQRMLSCGTLRHRWGRWGAGSGVSWGSCGALHPTPGTLDWFSLCFTALFAHLATHFHFWPWGNWRGEDVLVWPWAWAAGTSTGGAPRVGAQKHPHAGQLCSEAQFWSSYRII